MHDLDPDQTRGGKLLTSRPIKHGAKPMPQRLFQHHLEQPRDRPVLAPPSLVSMGATTASCRQVSMLVNLISGTRVNIE